MNMFNIHLCAQRLLLGTDGFWWLLHIFLLLIIIITVFEYSFLMQINICGYNFYDFIINYFHILWVMITFFVLDNWHYQCLFRGPAESRQKVQDFLKNQTTAPRPLIGCAECATRSRPTVVFLDQQQVSLFTIQELCVSWGSGKDKSCSCCCCCFFCE